MANHDHIQFEKLMERLVEPKEASSDFVETLWTKITEQSQPARKQSLFDWLKTGQRNWKFAWVGAALALVMMVTLVGPQRLIAAAQSLLTYLRGVGAVNTLEEVQILQEPVAVTSNGVTVELENLVSSSERTWVRLKFAGYTSQAIPASPDSIRMKLPEITRADGKTSQALNCDTYISDSLFQECQFLPLTLEDKQVRIVVYDLPDLSDPQVNTGWELQAALRPATESDTIPSAWTNPRDSMVQDGFTLTVAQVVHRADRTYIGLRIQTPTIDYRIHPKWLNQVQFLNEKGEILPFKQIVWSGRNNTALFETAKLNEDENYVVKLAGLEYSLNNDPQLEPPSFEFDPAKVAIGSTTPVDLVLTKPEYEILIDGLKFEQTAENGATLTIAGTLTRGNLSAFVIECSDRSLRCQSTAAYPSATDKNFKTTIQFDPVPEHVVKLSVAQVEGKMANTWEVKWQALANSAWTQALPEMVASTLSPQTDIQPTIAVTPLGQAEPTVAKETYSGLAKEVYDLLNKDFLANYSVPGWVHTITYSQGGTSVSSEPYTYEEWLLVDGNKRVEKEVAYVKYQNGIIARLTATAGSTSIDLNGQIQEVFRPARYVKVQPLAALIQSVQDNPQDKHGKVEISSNDVILDGKPTLYFSMKTTLNEISQSGPDRKDSDTYMIEYWIDRESGKLLQKKDTQFYTDGTQGTISGVERYETISAATPTQLVLDKLASIPGDGTFKQVTAEDGKVYNGFAASVYELLYKNYVHTYGQPGWVHRTGWVDDNQLVSGQQKTDLYYYDIWEYVEDDRSISKYWEKISDFDNNVISIFQRNDSGQSYLLGNSSPIELERPLMAAMGELPDRLENLAENIELQSGGYWGDGDQGISVIENIRFEAPRTIDFIPEPVIEQIRTTSISTVTGKMIWDTVMYLSVSGEHYTGNGVHIDQLQPGALPPAEVLDRFGE